MILESSLGMGLPRTSYTVEERIVSMGERA